MGSKKPRVRLTDEEIAALLDFYFAFQGGARVLQPRKPRTVETSLRFERASDRLYALWGFISEAQFYRDRGLDKAEAPTQS